MPSVKKQIQSLFPGSQVNKVNEKNQAKSKSYLSSLMTSDSQKNKFIVTPFQIKCMSLSRKEANQTKCTNNCKLNTTVDTNK